ncbi:ATP-binding protein [Pseudomonas mosselii]|uniref:ATP-dependent nuclease n=1 Tax=Pseudomonas mosselii TaxID=78327 RepID=UPI0018D6B9C5|nr:AAA family ATPase [Pseudomonas mosselii]MBH3310420.1 ATP-binding protein [Pseudomonas mosselii]MBH3324440.1 ATP-binding protein [Pseudomonas mosselii]
METIDNLKLKILNVKNIETAQLEFPLEKSLNLIVGGNGSGKSTVLLALSQAILKHSLKTLKDGDYDESSTVEIELNEKHDKWAAANNWKNNDRKINLNGMYEGSLFYGTRFNDSKRVDELLSSGTIRPEDIVEADDYIKEKLSYILTGTHDHYKDLKKIRNRTISERLKLDNTPYFTSAKGKLISQYRMSSGECLLISLLHFVYNAIVRRSLPQNEPILVLIDEIELALHPLAVSRFIDLINDLVKKSTTLMVILTSHSPEVIRKIQPKNIYKIENNAGAIDVINPGFPSYVIRDVYSHDGFDFLLLVEDILAKTIVDKILEQNNLKSSKLVHVVPVGGWSNVLTLQRDLLTANVLGIGREIISVIDGDVQDQIPRDFKDLRKLFLPIKSVEKFLYQIVIETPNTKLKRLINDKYFQVESLDTLAAEHRAQYPKGVDHPDKKLYFRLRKNLERRGIDELMFVHKLADDIMTEVSFDKFTESLKKVLSR